MKHLRKLIQQELPLNRKERFFTGTVFPMIVCRNDFKHFGEFLSLLGCKPIPVSADPRDTNIQFFTEYSLAESIIGHAKERFVNALISRDTPDILILIQNVDGSKILIAIEAKMYDTPDAEALTSQMDNQASNILRPIKEILHISQMYHCALLPDKLYQTLLKDEFGYQTITWEQVFNTYSKWYDNDYFLSMLQIALESYDELVSKGNSYGKNCEAKIRGEDIYKQCKNNTLDKVIMGRFGGINGDELREDIRSGGWRRRLYEKNSVMTPPNTNCFSIKSFVELIDQDRLPEYHEE